MRPLIGVTSLWDGEKKCGWMWQNYLELIWAAGGMPVVLSLNASDEAREEMLDIQFCFCSLKKYRRPRLREREIIDNIER